MKNYRDILKTFSTKQNNSAKISEDDLVSLKSALVGIKPNQKYDNLEEREEILSNFINIFNHLIVSLKEANGLGTYRTTACDTISVWLLRCNQLVKVDVTGAFGVEVLKSVNLEDVSDFLFQYICDFWTDSGAALGNALKELFIKLINLLKTFKQLQLQSNLNIDKLFKQWVTRILKFSKTMRVVYFILEVLIKEVGGLFLLEQRQFNIIDILSLMSINSIANPAGKTIVTLYKSIYSEYKSNDVNNYEEKWLYLWSDNVKQALKNKSLRRNVEIYLLPLLFKVSSNCYKLFIKSMNKESDHESSATEDDLSLLIGCLKIGQDLSIMEEPFHSDDKIISIDLINNLLHCKLNNLRIGAYSIIIKTSKPSRPLKSYLFEIIKNCIDDFILDSDLEFRNEFFGLTRQLIFRIRDSCYAMNRDSNKLLLRINDKINYDKIGNGNGDGNDIIKLKEQSDNLIKQVNEIKDFINWILKFIEIQLRPGSTYLRINFGLNLLNLLIKSGLDNNIDSKVYETKHQKYNTNPILNNNSTNPISINIFQNLIIVRLLIDNLTNDYEDIRETCLNILSMSSNTLINLNADSQIHLLKDRAFSLISGVRGRKGDGGAKVIKFIFNLYHNLDKNNDKVRRDILLIDELIRLIETSINYANSNFLKAICEDSIHGYFTSLKLIFEDFNYNDISIKNNINDWKLRIEKLLNCSFNIWFTVKDILSDDAPEGNLPKNLINDQNSKEKIKQVEKLYGPITQVLLSYSWRAIKESTSLVLILLSKPNNLIFSDELVIKSGNITLDQLSTIKHRGAFSSVYPTFVECCNRCYKSNSNNDITKQPEIWLKENLKTIKEKSQFITRRSGGLPFLITAILCSENEFKLKSKLKFSTPPLLDYTFQELLKIANEPVIIKGNNNNDFDEEKLDLPQVHAFNCIRSIFIESQLSQSSTNYIEISLKLSLNNFTNEIWAIRNCSVMLFTALQNKIFGTKKISNSNSTEESNSKLILRTIPARLFFSKFKNIRNLLLKNLSIYLDENNNKNDNYVESLYPVLTILSRLHSTNDSHNNHTNNNDNDELDEFKPLLNICLKNKNWKIREMAARSLPTLISTNNNNNSDLFSYCNYLLQNSTIKNQNQLHGSLLAIKELIMRFDYINVNKTFSESFNSSSVQLETIKSIYLKIDEFLILNDCSATATVYIQLLDYILYESKHSSKYRDEFLNYKNGILIQGLIDWFEYEMYECDFLNNQLQSLDSTKRILYSKVLKIILEFTIDAKIQSKINIEKYFNNLDKYPYELQFIILKFSDNYFEKFSLSASSQNLLNILLIKLVNVIEFKNSWDYVKVPCLKLLDKFLAIDGKYKNNINGFFNLIFDNVINNKNEEVREVALQTFGTLASILSNGTYNASTTTSTTANDKILHWFKIVKKFSNDTKPFSTRLSSLKSLINFLNGINLNNNNNYTPIIKDIIIKAHLNLFLFLSDDDEFIRDKAASFLSLTILKIDPETNLQLTSISIEKLVIKKLPEVLGYDFFSKAILNEILNDTSSSSISTKNLIDSILHPNEVLFIVEKSNLYRDLIKLDEQYASVLLKFKSEIPVDLLEIIKKKVLSDIEYLSNTIRLKGHDGLLGWAGDENAYLACSRVIIETNSVGLNDTEAFKELKTLFKTHELHDLCMQ